MRFKNRTDAGRRLAPRVGALNLNDPVVLGLNKGGTVVASPVARDLGAPLDVLLARRFRLPRATRLPFRRDCRRAPRAGGPCRRHRSERPGPHRLAGEAGAEIDQRVKRYRNGRDLPALADADVVLVDDGLATAVTVEAALRAVHAHDPRRVVFAVPVCVPETTEQLAPLVDDLTCVLTLGQFGAVQFWYEDIRRVDDGEILAALAAVPVAAAG